MLEKRSKVIEELLQTEKDYIKDLHMCVVEIIEPLRKKQVKTRDGLFEAVEMCIFAAGGKRGWIQGVDDQLE